MPRPGGDPKGPPRARGNRPSLPRATGGPKAGGGLGRRRWPGDAARTATVLGTTVAPGDLSRGGPGRRRAVVARPVGRSSDSRAERSGLRPDRSGLLAVASQPVVDCLGPVRLTAVVPAHRCGAVPVSHRVPCCLAAVTDGGEPTGGTRYRGTSQMSIPFLVVTADERRAGAGR